VGGASRCPLGLCWRVFSFSFFLPQSADPLSLDRPFFCKKNSTAGFNRQNLPNLGLGLQIYASLGSETQCFKKSDLGLFSARVVGRRGVSFFAQKPEPTIVVGSFWPYENQFFTPGSSKFCENRFLSSSHRGSAHRYPNYCLERRCHVCRKIEGTQRVLAVSAVGSPDENAAPCQWQRK